MSKTDEYAKKFADLMIRALENGTAPWIKPWKAGEIPAGPHNGITNRSYRGGNYMNLLLTQLDKGYETSDWMTFRQISEAGGKVKKGEKGTEIQWWKNVEPSEEQKREDPDAKTSRIVKYFYVFNRDQCEGLPERKTQLQVPVEWRHEKCEKLMADSGVKFNYDGGDRAFYRPDTDQIHMPSKAAFHSQDGFYATALHELGHSTGHKDRLNRDLSGKFGSERYAREELRAEFFSFLAGERLGIGHDPVHHAVYIKPWIAVLKNDPKEGLRASADVEKILTYLNIERYQKLQQEHVQSQDEHQEIAEPVKAATRRNAATKTLDPLAPEVLDAQIKEMKTRRKSKEKELAVAL